jgi:bacteriocin biosynthesis cyclodehydratase domain-containing protein
MGSVPLLLRFLGRGVSSDQDHRAAMVALTEFAALSLPDRPRLAPWLVAVPLGDARLQLRSAESTHTLNQPLLIEVFLRIQNVLDGRHTASEIVARAGPDVLPTTVVFLLKLLLGKGLLQPGAGETLLDEQEQARWRSQLRFLDHFVQDASNTHLMLTKARVGLVGSARLCREVSSSFNSIGVGVDSLGDPRTWCAESREQLDRPGNFDLVVACEDSASFSLFEAVNRACLRSGTRWLCVSVSGKAARLGPTFIPHQTACHTCLDLRLKTHQPDLEGYAAYRLQVDAPDSVVDDGCVAPFRSLVAAQAALEAMRLLTGFSPAVTVGRFYELSALSPAAASHEVFRVPRCPSCGRRRTIAQAWDRDLAGIAS